MLEFWNERYRQESFAYGTSPNQYFKAQLDQLAPGSLLLPAEGEGRNAVYAASLGWTVTAFDLSPAGRDKALQLAAEAQASFDYLVGDFGSLQLPDRQYDAMALIYAHFPPDVREDYFQRLEQYLKPGGHLIFEGFSKAQLDYQARQPQAGGPKRSDMLFDEAEMRRFFPTCDPLTLKTVEVDLQEGQYHRGRGSVVRLLARKRAVPQG